MLDCCRRPGSASRTHTQAVLLACQLNLATGCRHESASLNLMSKKRKVLAPRYLTVLWRVAFAMSQPSWHNDRLVDGDRYEAQTLLKNTQSQHTIDRHRSYMYESR